MKTNLDNFVLTDSKLEADGIDFAVGKVNFRLRRFGGRNPKLKSANLKYFKPHARAIELGTIDDDFAEDISIKAFVEACLVSWEGLLDSEGNEIACTPENAFGFFKERMSLFNILMEYARDHKNFLKEEFFAESAGN